MILGYLVIVVLVVFFLSSFVIIFGAPYVPTLSAQRKNALDLLDLKPGQTLYELGSGDGSLLVEAAARGIRAVGYELNPLLVMLAKLRGLKHRGLVSVRWSNFWKADLGQADGVFIFQMDRSMKRLEAKILKDKKGSLKVASHAFKIPGKNPARQKGAVFLYEYK
jgi:SAM-dependent methyltransferase